MPKTSNIKPKIIEFKREDAAQLAGLFNSFDKEGLWPGGFTGGVPFTAERVLDSFPVSIKSISILISTYKNEFTGICTLHPHYEDSEAAYIGVLGVHPDFLGKGHGKALILEALKIAAQKGLRRVDLDTWAGNLRAVPLYKKCGMFWIPETSVRMQDYIPGIKNFPLAKQFLEKHDWYSVQKRKLELVPDEDKLKEMDVFQYEFSEKDDNLKIWIDRYGRSIVGIRHSTKDERLSVIASLESHKVIAGIEENLRIIIENRTKKHIQGSALLSGFKGLNFTKQPQQSFTINIGETIELQSRFVVSPEVEVPSIERKQKTISANIIINGELIPLEIGMRILAPLEFKTQPESIIAYPGSEGPIQLNMYNNSTEAFIGKVSLIDEQERLSLEKTIIPVKIPPKSYVGFEAKIKLQRDQPTSTIPLKISAKGTIGKSEIQSRIRTIHVKCMTPGNMTSYIEETEKGKAIVIEQQDVRASIYLRGGQLEITYKDTDWGPQKIWTRGGFGVGPPFGFIRPVDHTYEIVKEHDCLKVVLSRMHQDKPGVGMRRTLTFYSDSSLIKDQIKVTNTNPDVTYELSARIFGRTSIGSDYSKLVIPLSTGILKHNTIGFPVSESDLPTDPKDYAESWVCFENTIHGFSFGQIWTNEKLDKIRAREGAHFLPEYKLGKTKPGKSASTSAFYYVVQKGSWRTIRRRYKSLIDKTLSPEEEFAPAANPLFDVKLVDRVLFDNNEMKTKISLLNIRNKPASGTLTIALPKGWKAKPNRIEIQGVTAEKPFSTSITIIPPLNVELGLFSGSLDFSAPNQEHHFPLNLYVASKQVNATTEITTKREQGKEIFKVSNGLLQYKASAGFAGCLYFLGTDSSLNQLGTSFPNIQTKVFLENYSGGVRSFYLDDEFNFQKSKTHEEIFTAEPAEEGLWKGIRFRSITEKQEEMKGIHGSVAYLTLPFSNIIKVKRRFYNPTSASFRFNNCLWISPNVGGVFKENDVVFPKGETIYHFKRAEGFAVSNIEQEKGWAVVVNKHKNQSLGVIAGNTSRSTILSLDIGNTMLELFIISRVLLLPRQTIELQDFILLGSEEIESIDQTATLLRSQLT